MNGSNPNDEEDEETFDHLEGAEHELGDCVLGDRVQNLLKNANKKKNEYDYNNSKHLGKVKQALIESLFPKDNNVDPRSHDGAILRMLEGLGGDDPRSVLDKVAPSLLNLLSPTLLESITTDDFHIEGSQMGSDSESSLAEKLSNEIDPNKTKGKAVVYMLIFEGTVQQVIKKLKKALSIPNFGELYPEMSMWVPKKLKQLSEMDASERIRIIYIGEISSLNQTVILRWESEANPDKKDGAGTQWEFGQIVGWTHRVVVAVFELGDKGLSWLMECFTASLIKCFSNRSAANGTGRQIELLAIDASSCNKICTGPPEFLLRGGVKAVIDYVKTNYEALKNASILSQIYVPQHLLSFINDMFDTIKRFNKDVKEPKDVTGYHILGTMGKICKEKELGIFAHKPLVRKAFQGIQATAEQLEHHEQYNHIIQAAFETSTLNDDGSNTANVYAAIDAIFSRNPDYRDCRWGAFLHKYVKDDFPSRYEQLNRELTSRRTSEARGQIQRASKREAHNKRRLSLRAININSKKK
jgi:hypothetical protein